MSEPLDGFANDSEDSASSQFIRHLPPIQLIHSSIHSSVRPFIGSFIYSTPPLSGGAAAYIGPELDPEGKYDSEEPLIDSRHRRPPSSPDTPKLRRAKSQGLSGSCPLVYTPSSICMNRCQVDPSLIPIPSSIAQRMNFCIRSLEKMRLCSTVSSWLKKTRSLRAPHRVSFSSENPSGEVCTQTACAHFRSVPLFLYLCSFSGFAEERK